MTATSARGKRLGVPLGKAGCYRTNEKQRSLELLDNMPPSDLKIERSVVGGVMIHWQTRNAVKRVLQVLDGFDFHGEQWCKMFLALRGLMQNGNRLTGLEMAGIGGAIGTSMRIGHGCGSAFVAEALYDACYWESLWPNAGRLRQLRIKREQVRLAEELLRLSHAAGQFDDKTEDDWLKSARVLVASLSNRKRL